MEPQDYWMVGVDGGGTKSIIRLEDSRGCVVGEVVSGPANICLSVENAWRSIKQGLQALQQQLGITLSHHTVHAGMGLAGMELTSAYEAFIQEPHEFASLMVKSDAYIACLGAHNFADGGIIIAGTGAVGFQIIQGQMHRTGGFGFPQDDEGSGAWLGLEAIKVTLKALDGRLPASSLSQSILTFFNDSRDEMVAWSTRADTTQFASLAPLVIREGEKGCATATRLLQQAAAIIDHLGKTMISETRNKVKAPLPITLVGGIAPYLKPYFSDDLKRHIVNPVYSSAEGAIMMVKAHLKSLSAVQHA